MAPKARPLPSRGPPPSRAPPGSHAAPSRGDRPSSAPAAKRAKVEQEEEEWEPWGSSGGAAYEGGWQAWKEQRESEQAGGVAHLKHRGPAPRVPQLGKGGSSAGASAPVPLIRAHRSNSAAREAPPAADYAGAGKAAGKGKSGGKEEFDWMSLWKHAEAMLGKAAGKDKGFAVPQMPLPPLEDFGWGSGGSMPSKGGKKGGKDKGKDKGKGKDKFDDKYNFCVKLSHVPVEYTHEILVELHESLGLDPKSLESSKVVEEPSPHGTVQIMLRYSNEMAAQQAARELDKQEVMNKVGESVIIEAHFRKSEGPVQMYPSLYISDLPAEFKDRDLRELHAEVGLSTYDLVSMKFLASRDYGETCCCIARYCDDAAANKALEALKARKVVTSRGNEKWIGVRAAKPARWMEQTGRGVATQFALADEATKAKWETTGRKAAFNPTAGRPVAAMLEPEAFEALQHVSKDVLRNSLTPEGAKRTGITPEAATAVLQKMGELPLAIEDDGPGPLGHSWRHGNMQSPQGPKGPIVRPPMRERSRSPPAPLTKTVVNSALRAKLEQCLQDVPQHAKTRDGCNALKKAVDVAVGVDWQTLHDGVMNSFQDLCRHHVGHEVVVKLVQRLTGDQLEAFCWMAREEVVQLVQDSQGSKSMKKIISTLVGDKQLLVIEELQGHMLEYMQEQNASDFIRHCIETLPQDFFGYVILAMENQVESLACDVHGCQCICSLIATCAQKETLELLDWVLQQIVDHGAALARHKIGHKAFDLVLESCRDEDKQRLMMVIQTNLVEFVEDDVAHTMFEKVYALPDEPPMDELKQNLTQSIISEAEKLAGSERGRAILELALERVAEEEQAEVRELLQPVLERQKRLKSTPWRATVAPKAAGRRPVFGRR
eukprot:TRINITY_DN27835_c0_g1_i1.p1 TRINITY_DN27835_c0_g1~~TRINITY_DN27835_c0_g1_i1.p1  ORF type:complete len:885 (+),score=260.80 TRINITY_DN27835_c0_g1_i1:94-2748(+)